MTRTLTVEQRVLTGSLHIVLKVHKMFTRQKLEWMARSLESYREEVVREFYDSYVATLRVLWTC